MWSASASALEASFFTQAGLPTRLGLRRRTKFLRHRRTSHVLGNEIGEVGVVQCALIAILMTDPLWPSMAQLIKGNN